MFGLVRDGVSFATEADLYAIVDWHVLSDANPLAHADEAAGFFGRISADLSTNNNVIYEICNEPNNGTTWEDVKAYAQRIIPIIRANDPDAVIIVGTPTWCQDVDQAAAAPLDAGNVMYALHFYAATHQADLRDRMAATVRRASRVRQRIRHLRRQRQRHHRPHIGRCLGSSHERLGRQPHLLEPFKRRRGIGAVQKHVRQNVGLHRRRPVRRRHLAVGRAS